MNLLKKFAGAGMGGGMPGGMPGGFGGGMPGGFGGGMPGFPGFGAGDQQPKADPKPKPEFDDGLD